jgi:molybdopterin-guanine dinucleotide biosynthesis protein A
VEVNGLAFDAVILAGGRSSRLGGVPKQSLVFQGQSLLERAVAAAAGARHVAVVGEMASLPIWPPNLLSCREQPHFAGPAAAIAAGLDALADIGEGAPYLLVLACDMPLASQAVAALQEALQMSTAADPANVMAAEGDRPQPLVGFYRTPELTKACRDLAARGALVNGSVRSLLANLDVQLVTVPAGSTSDVDTWDDAAALGIAAGNQSERQDRQTGGANVGGNS